MLFKCMEILDAGGGQRDYRFSVRVPESSEALFKLGKSYDLVDVSKLTLDQIQPSLMLEAERDAVDRARAERQQSPQGGASEPGDVTQQQTLPPQDPANTAPSKKAGKE